jgi:hypothetical protein
VDFKPALIALLSAVLVVACGQPLRAFAPRAPLARDTDLASVRVPCHLESTPKDPRHVSCAPRVYVSPLAWDGIDNSIFRPASDALAVPRATEATNANSIDEVADSAWFTNRIGVRDFSIDELRRGACTPAQVLETPTEPGAWVIDKGKGNGSSLGFRISVPGRGKYMIKIDAPEQPERATAASVIGAAAYHAVGFFTSCEQAFYVDPSVFKLTPGLRYEDNSGQERDFDQKVLDRVLADATKWGRLVRVQASAWLPGYLIGPFRYEGLRDDDPNDAIPHEDRRELRGGRLLAAWIDHKDAREQNSMDTWLADDPKRPDSSPGYVRHYYLDMSDTLGSEWAWDAISRRLGRSYVLDWGDIGADFVTLGIPTRDWEKIERTRGREKFGYFQATLFDPEGWKNEYPNPAFSRMTERDGAWMARLLARFTPEMVRALAEMGQFTTPGDDEWLAEVLEARLEKILARYLTRLSPLADVRLDASGGGASLCAVDLARRRHIRDEASFRYGAWVSNGQDLLVTALPDGAVCVRLPPSRTTDDAANPGYLVVRITNGVAPGELAVHLHDYGPTRGYRVGGLERPERKDAR